MRRQIILAVVFAGVIVIAISLALIYGQDPDPLACDASREGVFVSETEVQGPDGPKPFRVGQPLKISYSYKNCTDRVIAIEFLAAYFSVSEWYGDAGAEIWSDPEDITGSDLREEALFPNKTATHSVTWSGPQHGGTFSAAGLLSGCFFDGNQDCPEEDMVFFEVED